MLCTDFDPNRVPSGYLEKLTGNEDYTNSAQDGLSFKKGQTVYLLLRNEDGW